MAGHIPEAVIEDVRNRADIVEIIGSYIPVKKRGADYWALCPFHREKTPSFKISPGRQAFYCFGCKKSGNVFHFVQEQENVDFVGSVRLLAQRVGVHIPEPTRDTRRDDRPDQPPRQPKERLYEVLNRAAEWYQQRLRDPEAEKARQYIEGRGLTPEVTATFGLGYSPDSWDAALKWGERCGYDHQLMIAAGLATPRETGPVQGCYDRFRDRLMFPIWDELGRVVGFSARMLDRDAKSAKYVNTPETAVFHKGKLLYGLHLARQQFKEVGHALICEGQLDVIACHRAGVTNAVSPQGTAFTEEHARLLKRFAEEVTFAFDADAAGEKAAVRSIEVSLAVGLTARVVALPPGEDPDSLLGSGGPDALRQAMAATQDAFGFVLGLAKQHHNPTTPEGRTSVVQEVLDIVATLTNPVNRSARCQWLSREMDLPESAVFSVMNEMMRDRRRNARRGSFREDPGGAGAPPAPAGILSMAEKAKLTLLDLALHHGFIAHHERIQSLSQEDLGETPAGQALNHVIALTAQGEWSLAGRELAKHHALAADAEIGRVLGDPSFKHLDPEHAADHEREDMEERLLKAMDDCLRQLQLVDLERLIRENQRALAEEEDPAKARELLRESQELVKHRHQLKSGA